MKNRHPLWTLENGNCVHRGWIQKNLTDMDELEQCVFYFKCKSTNSTTTGCDDVIRLFHPQCKNKTINYPSGPVFKPYIQTIYHLSELKSSKEPNYVFLNGSIKCVGYQAHFTPNITFATLLDLTLFYRTDTLFCHHSEKRDILGPQIDKNCWNDTKQSFYCQKNSKCISKHRLRNGISDCTNAEDEDDNQSCYMKKQHRLNCSGESSVCLLVSKIGENSMHCPTANDEYITQLKWNLADHKCTTSNSIECNVLKTYIQSPSSLLTAANNKVLLFRQYCDTVWHLPRGFDESLCKEWKCPKEQYQCLSGHCITIDYVIDAYFAEWNCPDASDNIGVLGITQLSEHNAKIISQSDLQKKKTELTYDNGNSYFVPFTALCNASKEYGCILANVNDSLNFIINRPCINVTQIDDGIIDCYGGLDERNLLTCGNNVDEQRGFDFHCSDQECIPYHLHCKQRCSNNADSLLCDQLQTVWSSSCQYPTRDDMCGLFLRFECDPFQIAKYYCDTTRQGK
jgi:hypothetical protein